MTWLLLAGAIVAEVTATVALRASDGFSKLVPSVVVVLGYIISFYLLSLVLTRGLALGVVYAVWSAAGATLVALVGVLGFDDRLTWTQVGGILLVIVGVVTLELGGAH